jgi:Glycosyltransferase like family 2
MATFTVIVGSAGRPQLKTMLESIKRQDRQPGDQCIVVLDSFEQGTRDDAQELVRSYGDGFVAAAYNSGYHWLGVEQVNYAIREIPITGSHVLLLGDDDVFVDGAYAKIRPVCEAHPGRAVLWQVVMPHDKRTGHRAILPERQAIARSTIGGSSVAAPREHIGLHSTKRYVSHDYDWLVDVIKSSGRDPVWLMEAFVVTRPEAGGYDVMAYPNAGILTTPKRLITTWICNASHGTYRERDKRLFYRCLESWHRLMPDYDIRIVSIGNLFEYGSEPWAEAQLRAMNGIGLSQWVKLFWTYQIGGVSLDMDQEALARFDGLLDATYFTGHFGAEPFVGNGITGAPKGHPFLLEQLAHLGTLDVTDPQFGNESGPRLVTKLLKARGWDGTDRHQRMGDITIYPHQTFYPYHWREQFTPACVTPETVAVHHWASSWDQQNPQTPAWRRSA